MIYVHLNLCSTFYLDFTWDDFKTKKEESQCYTSWYQFVTLDDIVVTIQNNLQTSRNYFGGR